MTIGNDTILLVEDDAADIELTTHIIKEKAPSARVVIAKNGSEALEFLFSNQDSIYGIENKHLRLIILDLHMPGIDGFEVLTRIKSDDVRKQIPVVILTSSQETKDIEYCYLHNANSYVVKPISVEQYEKVIENILTFWFTVNETPTTHLSISLVHTS